MRIVGVFVALTVLLTSSADTFAQLPPPRPQPQRPARPGPPGAKKTTAESLPDDLRPVYEKAAADYHLGDSQTALAEFQLLYERVHDPRLLWNIAACQKNLRRYTKAIGTLQAYMSATGDLVSDQDRRDAADLIQSLSQKTTAISLYVAERDADVWLDDESLGKTPLATSMNVDLGTHKVRAQKEGFRTFEKTIEIGPSVNGLPTTINVPMELVSGRLELQVPPDAATTVDDKDVGRGPAIAMDLPIGAHVVKVTAPKMRPYQAEVQVEDGKTKALTIVMERDVAQVAELRVAVGCGDEAVRTPEQRLSVYVDDATLSAQPLGVRLHVGPDDPAFVAFSVTPGPHQVRVAVPGCETLSVATVASPERPAAVTGMLPKENPFFNGSPAGTPSGFHLGLGWDYSFLDLSSFYSFGTSAALNPTGPVATIGTVGRWWEVVFDVRYLFASTSLASLQQFDTGIRFGPRIPLYYAVLSGGVGGSFGYFNTSATANGTGSANITGGSSNGATARAFGWAAVDIRPLCDWGIEVGWQQSFLNAYANASQAGGQNETALLFQALYQPNAMCSRSRDGLYKLDGTGTLSN